MSFILDALKKSEIERQRQSVPGLMDTRLRERRTRLPIWAIVVAVLLGVNLLLLAFVLWHRNSPAVSVAPRAESAAPPAASPPEAADSAPSVAPHFSPLDPSPVYAPEIPVPAAENHAPVSLNTAPAGAAAKVAVHAVRRSEPLLSDDAAPAENQEILPSISEINLTGAQALPELHLDVHVYSTKPADRFVYINMRKYHEGAALPEGPSVERIRRDGVVLTYQGLRFLLPRQP
jgi:general secretion pathway protein B